MAENQIDEIVTSAIEKIKSISDVSSVVGEVMNVNGVTMLPISKMSVGFVAGGGEYGASDKEIKKTKSYPFSGGSGGGVCVHPVGFLCIVGKDVKFVRVDGKSPYDKIIETVPRLAQSLIEGLKKDKKDEKNN